MPYESCILRNQNMSFWSLALLFTAGHQELPGMPKNLQGLPGRFCINPQSKFEPCVLCNQGCLSSQPSSAWFVWLPVMITRNSPISCSRFHVHILSQQIFCLIHHHDVPLWVSNIWMYHWSLWHFLAFLTFSECSMQVAELWMICPGFSSKSKFMLSWNWMILLQLHVVKYWPLGLRCCEDPFCQPLSKWI